MSKPMGPIPAGYEDIDGDGMLMLGGWRADELAARGTPMFVYDLRLVDRQVARFRQAFPSIDLHYAIKANSYGELLSHIVTKVDGLDIASAGELKFALDAGGDPSEISFAGPGKGDDELAAAIEAGVTLNCESEGEAERAIEIADRCGRILRIAIRVNPDFEIKGAGMRMGGGAKPFGVDAERVPALVNRLLAAGTDWRGFHIFAGSQALSAEALIEAQRATLDLAAKLSDDVGVSPDFVNLGGGFGIPYFHGEQPLDVERVGEELVKALKSRPQSLEKTRFAIELGRWLVGECGVYLTRIVDRKESHGKTFLITDGGMQHQLAASGNFGQVVRRNYPIAIAHGARAEAAEEVTIVGCLCTPLDRLADDVALPRADVGDLVAVFLAGAYGLSASPQAFLAQRPAREMLVDGAR